jgi:hypothetical protein
MAGPIPVTIASLGAPVPLFAWYLTGAFGVLCVGLNVIGGNLKDLESVDTTASASGWERNRYRDLEGLMLTELDLREVAAAPAFTAINA